MKIAAVLMSAMASDCAGPTPLSSRSPKIPQSDAIRPMTASNSGKAISMTLAAMMSPPGTTAMLIQEAVLSRCVGTDP